MNNNLVWFPFYIGDYLKDTQHLNVVEHGMYLKLILFYYSTGKPIPHLRRYSIADASSIPQAMLEHGSGNAMCDQLLAEFFHREGDAWHHNRIDRELAKQQDIAEKHAERARKGAEARWLKQSSKDASRMLQASDKQCLMNAQSQSQSHIVGDKSPTTPAKVELPEWLDKETWTAFKEHRQRLRKPMTAKAAELIITKLDTLRGQGDDPKAVLEQSIERGWQGVFSTKEKSNGSTSRGGYEKPSLTQTIAQQLDELARGV